MGFNSIYLVELMSSINQVTCRNTFHFRMKGSVISSFQLCEYFKFNLFDYIKPIFSFDTMFAEIRARQVDQALLDSYQMQLQQEVGTHPASATDPRLCVKWSLHGDHAFGPNSTGRLFWSGIPLDWAQVPPRFSDFGQSAHKTVADDLLHFFGKNGSDPNLEWGVFSKRNHIGHEGDYPFYWFPIIRAYVNPLISSLRTRRMRGPF